MDKKVIFAVAGSGKTTRIVEQLDETRGHLLITYTNANRDNLRNKIINRFGYFPENIRLYTYFEFLHGFCYLPFLQSQKKTKGITFENPPRYVKPKDDRRFISPGKRLYHKRLSDFIDKTKTLPLVIERIEKYFDAIYVDEIQDFAGYDFNFLMAISQAKVSCLFVGDFYQHTYDTSRDGSVNKNLHDNYLSYRERFKKKGIEPDIETLKTSRRCSKTVCEFITEKIGIEIQSIDGRESCVRLEQEPSEVMAIYEDSSVVKLFLKEHYKYACYSQNWGASKGIDHYQDVCVVLSDKNLKHLKNGNLRDINSLTKNKLYVASSRARGNLIFVPEKILRPYKKR